MLAPVLLFLIPAVYGAQLSVYHNIQAVGDDTFEISFQLADVEWCDLHARLSPPSSYLAPPPPIDERMIEENGRLIYRVQMLPGSEMFYYFTYSKGGFATDSPWFRFSVLSFEHGVDSSEDGFVSILFQPLKEAPLDFLDVHYTVNEGEVLNYRMEPSAGSAATYEHPRVLLQPQDSLAYSFTFRYSGESAMDSDIFYFSGGDWAAGNIKNQGSTAPSGDGTLPGQGQSKVEDTSPGIVQYGSFAPPTANTPIYSGSDLIPIATSPIDPQALMSPPSEPQAAPQVSNPQQIVFSPLMGPPSTSFDHAVREAEPSGSGYNIQFSPIPQGTRLKYVDLHVQKEGEIAQDLRMNQADGLWTRKCPYVPPFEYYFTYMVEGRTPVETPKWNFSPANSPVPIPLSPVYTPYPGSFPALPVTPNSVVPVTEAPSVTSSSPPQASAPVTPAIPNEIQQLLTMLGLGSGILETPDQYQMPTEDCSENDYRCQILKECVPCYSAGGSVCQSCLLLDQCGDNVECQLSGLCMICSGSENGPPLCPTIQSSCQANADSILSSSAETLGIGGLGNPEASEEFLSTFDELTRTGPQQTPQQETSEKIENIVSETSDSILSAVAP